MAELEENWDDVIFNIQEDEQLETQVQQAVSEMSDILSREQLRKHGLKAQLAIILTSQTRLCLNIAATSPKHWQAVRSFLEASYQQSLLLMNELAIQKAEQVEKVKKLRTLVQKEEERDKDKEDLKILKTVNDALKDTLEPQKIVGSEKNDYK